MRRIFRTLQFLSLPVLLLFGFFPFAQTAGSGCKPPINRQLYHDYIDREQKAALRADGKSDVQFSGSANDDINFLVTRTLVQRIDALQCSVEKDSVTNHQKKVTYLRGLEKMIKNFTAGYKNRSFNVSNLPAAVETYETAMNRDKTGASAEHIFEKVAYEVGNLVFSSSAFDANPGYKASKNSLLLKYAHAHPAAILSTLNKNPDVPFRDSLILVVAYKNPKQLYDYAAASNRLGSAIRKIDDPLVKIVSKMATSGGSGQIYLPFLDNILKGRQTIEEIDAIKGDNVKYFKLLVKTRMAYVTRLMQKDTAFEMAALTKRLEDKAKSVFIKQINDLHEEPDAVRFRILGQLNAQELYYLAVSSEDEIYTSSYVRGVYPAMMQKTGNRGDSLLVSVGFDRFKKFIKLAASFNTLSNFLGTFPNADQSKMLMTAFVNGLEKSAGLEDGVDVADSYASIAETIKPLAADMLNNVKQNYDRNVAMNNQRGMVTYNLLYKLFLSADSTKNIDLSKEFGIPPVYSVSYASLAGDSGTVIMQVFFYGDEDGRNNYAGFIRQFSDGNWKRTETKELVSLSSTKGKSIRIVANKPLSEETGDDEKAQSAVLSYLSQNGLEPTIVVHRGHSYYAKYTIEQIPSSAKIVFLGSCGGFHLLHDVLDHAPDAHIISSKQIGKTVINQPFFNLLNDKLRSGNNIDWIPFWKEFKDKAGREEGFDDYIPPHKNLGAIFIKAYKTQMGEGGEVEG